jgi:HEAT repeat protein
MRAKKEIKKLLEENKYHELNTLFPDKRKLITLLISSTYDKSDVVAWRAMEAIGLITANMSREKPDFVRDVVNRLLWMIRDESGGFGWSCPEILSEIIKNNPELCKDIATVVASFHEEEMLKPGVMLAIGRIGNIHTYFYDFAAPIVTSYLDDPDPATRAYAAYAAGELDIPDVSDKLEEMGSDTSPVVFYEDGLLKEKTVGKIADTALAKLRLNAILKTAV